LEIFTVTAPPPSFVLFYEFYCVPGLDPGLLRANGRHRSKAERDVGYQG